MISELLLAIPIAHCNKQPYDGSVKYAVNIYRFSVNKTIIYLSLYVRL